MKEAHLLEEAENAVRTCLAEVPFLRLDNVQRHVQRGRSKLDLLLRIEAPDGEQTLVCEFKGSGQPRSVREAVRQLLDNTHFWPNAHGVVIAPYISPASAEICSQQGIGYVDLAGNCRLSFGQVYIRKEGKPNPFVERRDLRSLYSPRATRVLRVLLSNPHKKWKVQALAEEAAVSLGQSYNVKKLLRDREWIQTDAEGFTLSEPWVLLEEWAASNGFRRSPKWDLYSLRSVGEIEAQLAQACFREDIRYAFTGFSGAARVAPFVRYQRATVYVEGDTTMISRLISMLDLQRVTSGANVSLWMPYDQGVFYGLQDFGGVQIVSPVQIYLDLRALGGRGEDAAKFLLDTNLKPQW